ncbi:hypothetical protein Lal_00018561 [Lupinus albus]|nr:hypothetical protein Lal_00018561 [Lupinus albus]
MGNWFWGKIDLGVFGLGLSWGNPLTLDRKMWRWRRQWQCHPPYHRGPRSRVRFRRVKNRTKWVEGATRDHWGVWVQGGPRERTDSEELWVKRLNKTKEGSIAQHETTWGSGCKEDHGNAQIARNSRSKD